MTNTVSIQIRSLPDRTARQFRAGAAARSMTFAEYFVALVDLHNAIRARADAGDDTLQAELTARGLESEGWTQ